MAALRYYAREAAMSLWRGRAFTVLSMLAIAAAILVLGVFLLLGENAGRLFESWSATAELSVYLRDDVQEGQRQSAQKALEKDPAVARVEYVSKEAALERFRRDFPDLAPATSTGSNPFPASLEARLADSSGGGQQIDRLADRLRGMQGVADVRYDRLWLTRLRAIGSLGWWAGMIIGVVLSLAAALTVSSVVRLALVSRREEIEIMELVGAPPAVMKGPFIIEGVMQGALGALLALVVLAGCLSFAKSRLAAPASALMDVGSIAGLSLGAEGLLVLGGMAVGFLGAVMATRRGPRA